LTISRNVIVRGGDLILLCSTRAPVSSFLDTLL